MSFPEFANKGEKRISDLNAMKYIERHSCDGCGGANLFLSGFM